MLLSKKMRMTKLPKQVWQTLVTDEITISEIPQKPPPGGSGGAGGMPPPPLEPVVQSQVKAANDATWLAMNEAGLKLLKKTGGQDVEPLKTFYKEERFENAKHVQEKKMEKKKKRVSKPTVPVSLSAEKEKEPETKRPMKETHVPPAEKMGAIKIVSIEEHNHRDNELELFKAKMPINKLATTAAVANAVNPVITAPPINKEQVLAYAEFYRRRNELWFNHMNQRVANTDYTYPDSPIFSRKYLTQFLREPKPSERPCINPEHGELIGVQFRCIAHYLSEKQLGAGKGYRLREMVIEENSTIPEMCYLCHLYFCLMNSVFQRDKQNEQTRKTTQESYKEHITILNRFRVFIDTVGEYDGTKMLISDKIDSGIWGNIPLFNEENYVACKVGGFRAFKEDNNLLFQPTQVTSDRVVSVPQKDSTRFAQQEKLAVRSFSQN